ncbi:hypothetical protein LCGC14_2910660 [marine sediment metagenome]|uniref:Uncharacterized protein n=1 Tax=marine sediment metagenome TaxID=412755 RepID=A0A0F9AHV1_9ZZZZ
MKTIKDKEIEKLAKQIVLQEGKYPIHFHVMDNN